MHLCLYSGTNRGPHQEVEKLYHDEVSTVNTAEAKTKEAVVEKKNNFMPCQILTGMNSTGYEHYSH